MAVSFGILLIITIIIFVLSYLKIVYECVRHVKIRSSVTATSITSATAALKSISTVTGKSTVSKQSSDIIKSFKQAPGPLPLPIIGNLNLLGQYEVPFEGFTDLAKKFGDVYTLTLGTTRCLIVNNLNLIREVLNQNGKHFGGRPNFIRYSMLFGGDRNNSLALCDWSQLQQKRRNLARRHCSPKNYSSFYEKMSEVGNFEMQEFMEKLNDEIIPGKDYHLKPLIMQTCANMFSKYMCSVRFDYNDKGFTQIVRNFDEIFWEINQGYAVDFLPWLLPFYSGHMKKLCSWSSQIRKFILERIINEREQNLDNDEQEKDFTDALLKSLAEDPNVTRDAIIYMLEDFIGGHSAIGNLVMLALAHIVKNPEIGKKIQDEVDYITKTEKRSIILTDTEKMPYTVATVYEVLRYSSSPIVPHVATEDVTIAGYGVTKGTVVFINNYELNTSEKYWDNPKEFNPERFLEPAINKQSPKNPRKFTDTSSSDGSDSGIDEQLVTTTDGINNDNKIEAKHLKKNIPHFLPFSIGKRTCIGQNLVKGFGFMMLARILQAYDVSCSDLNLIKTYRACVALPPETFPLILKPRQL